MKRLILIFSLLVFSFSLLTADAFGQSRTNRLWRPCPNEVLSLTPTTPAQVSINRNGSIDILPCYQQTFTVRDPHTGTAGFAWNSQTGFGLLAPAEFIGPGYFTFGNSVAIYAGTGATPGNWNIHRTITAGGTTGNQTINKLAGTVNLAAAAASVTVTNSLVNANSIVFAVIRTADATCLNVRSVVPGAGSFVITLNAACTAETSVGFLVTN